MSVFEDLIDELKNENLLENTVIDLKRADAAARAAAVSVGDAPLATGYAFTTSDELSDETTSVSQNETSDSGADFFRKRAMDELSGLQMVEHVLAGIEREHSTSAPAAFDDLKAKTALHRFIQVSGDPKSVEHAEAEAALRRELEAWSYAHYQRDRKISVTQLRRFCEDCRPVLSSQALVALARFYRNSPFSEDVREKFECVMTRLFSRETGEGIRRLLFDPREMIGHINALYANWSSIALYTRDDDQLEVSLTVTRLGEFREEVENAVSFEALLNSGFFDRVRAYKEECSEMFYVADVVTEAIKCNLAVGNRFVEFIAHERDELGAEKVEEKYGSSYEDVVSAVACKTLVLSELLAAVTFEHGNKNAGDVAESRAKPLTLNTKARTAKTSVAVGERFGVFGVNKWLVITCVVLIVLSVGVYIWAEKFAGGPEPAAAVATPVEIDDPDIKKFLRTPRATKETLYAVTEPTFDTLSETEKKELLGKVRKIANSKKLNKVALLDNSGKTVAFATEDSLELVSQ